MECAGFGRLTSPMVPLICGGWKPLGVGSVNAAQPHAPALRVHPVRCKNNLAESRRQVLIRIKFGARNVGRPYVTMPPNCVRPRLPIATSPAALTGSIPGDAVADLLEASELFNIDVDHLAGGGTFITARRLGRIQVAYPV